MRQSLLISRLPNVLEQVIPIYGNRKSVLLAAFTTSEDGRYEQLDLRPNPNPNIPNPNPNLTLNPKVP